MINISFDLGHPAHYLAFRNVLSESENIGFKPFVFIQEKGRLKESLIEDGIRFFIRKNKGTTFSRISLLPKDIIQIIRIMKQKKIEANFGKCSIVGSWAAKILNKRSIVIDDTDTANGQIFLFRRVATEIWTPQAYYKNLGQKHKKFNGIFQLAYLDPSVFKPDYSIPKSLGLTERGKPIFIRIIDYQAAHDWKYKDTREDFNDIIKELDRNYEIILSVETKNYPRKWEKYIKKFKPSDYHHILAFSKLYIGAGASTAAEAAVLGVPSIYTNHIKPGFIKLLEEKYKIIKSINRKSLNLLMIEKLLTLESNKWIDIKNRLLSDFINVPDLIRKLIKREIDVSLNN